MRNKKLAMSLAVLSAGALALSACSATGEPGSSDPISLRMTIFDDSLMDTFNGIADEYLKDHPEIKDIKFDSLPFDSYNTAVTTQLASGSGPDMAWMLESDAPTYMNANALYDLTPTFQSVEGYNYEDLAPAATKLWVSDGSLYAYPFSTSTFGMFYNKDLLSAAGLPTPEEMIEDNTWTWDELATTAGVAAAATGQTGFSVSAFDYKRWDNLSLIWRSFGAQPWSADGAECLFDQPEMVSAFEFIHDATFEKNAFLKPGMQADFSAGQSVFYASTVSSVGSLAESTFDWGLVQLPEGPDGAVPIFGQAAVGVFSSSKSPEAAAEFLAFFTNPTNSKLLAAAYPPPRESLLTTEVLGSILPLLTPEQIQNVVIDGVTNGEVKPSHEGFDEILSTVRAALDPLWTPDGDAATVLKDVCGKVQPLLSGN